jgi:hypothetical protein
MIEGVCSGVLLLWGGSVGHVNAPVRHSLLVKDEETVLIK